MADIAFGFSIILNRSFLTKDGIHKVQRHVVLQIASLARCRGVATSTATTKQIAEDIAKIAKAALTETALTEAAEALTATKAALRASGAKLIILSPFLLIMQYFIGFIDFFEFFFGSRLMVDVWMILSRQLPIGPINFSV